VSSRAALFATAAFATAVVIARPARADVEIETQIGARQIELGDTTQLQITALASAGEALQNPRLAPVPGLQIDGPSMGSRTQVSINNGHMVQQRGVSATWSIRGVKLGTYRFAASIDANGQRHQGQTATLEVVPPGTLQRRGPQGFDPFRMFDPFGSGSPFPGLLGPNDFGQQPEEAPPVPEEYRVDRALDPLAFLRATITPKHPVVGEQVTLKLYTYGARGPYNVTNLTDFTHADFLDYSSKDDGDTNDFVKVPIGDTMYLARKVRELQLFPLHSGRLTIGPASLTFVGGRYRANAPITRSTAPILLDVNEPPLDGRPSGYRVGDVGTLSLSVAVDPRRVTAGDSVGIVAKLEGTGSIPTTLRVPEQRGVEWLDPTHVDQVEAENGVVRGFRAFNYVVKLQEPGDIDLGELKVSYWDPKRRAYGTASAALGKVTVLPNQKPKPAASAAPDRITADPLALKPRRNLGAYSAPPAPFTDGWRFWALLFGAPLAVAVSGLGLELGSRIQRNRSRALSSPERLAQEALKNAESAARGSEIAKTAAAAERALFLAIEAGTGLRARALLKDDLKAQLAAAGVAAATIDRALRLLDACESARFTGKAGDLPPRELHAEARKLVAELGRKRKKS
jgi:hypothetical protein